MISFSSCSGPVVSFRFHLVLCSAHFLLVFLTVLIIESLLLLLLLLLDMPLLTHTVWLSVERDSGDELSPLPSFAAAAE